MPVTYDPPDSGVNTLDGDGDDLTIDLDNGSGSVASHATGSVSGSVLALSFDTDDDSDFDDDVVDVEDFGTVGFSADPDGSNVTLSGDLSATAIGAITFEGGASADSFDGSGISSSTPLDLAGNGGNDTLAGGAGDDVLTGGADLDVLDGGSDDGSSSSYRDVAAYSDTLTSSDIVEVSGLWQVTSAADGTDSLTEIETVRDGAGNDFLLVGGDGFGSIQSAIDAASDGDTIVIAAGTWNESVTITKAVTIVGAGVGSTIVTPPGANQSGFRIDSDLGAGNGVSIRGISFVDATQSGIQFTSSGVLGTLAIEDCAFEGNYRNGVEVLNGTGLGAIAISDSTFTDNGGQDTGDLVQTSSGDGDILLFQYTGDATLSNLALSNGGQAIATAENGIQFRSDTGAMGSVSLTDITISGSYEKVPLAIYNYDDVSGLSATNVVITADSTSFQHAVNFDGVGGAIDFSALGVDVSGAPDPIALQGDATANAFTSGAENAILVGNGGSDTLDGGGGDDSFLEYVGDGSDSLTGGSGSDTLTVRLDNDFVPPIGQANGDSSDLSGTLNGSNQLELSWGDTGHVDTVSGIESIVITADADGSSVTLSGDLSLAGVSPSTVTFVGGPGNDSYDGSGVVGVDQEIFGNGGDDTLSGGAGNDTIDGGADDDTLEASGGVDTLNGGSGIDTYDASGQTMSLNIDLAAGTATGSLAGTGATLSVGYYFPDTATLYAGASYTPATFAIGSGQETDVDVESVTHLLVDFDAGSLSIAFDTILSNPTWSNTAFNGLIFGSDLAHEILTASVDGSTTMAGFANGNVTFTADEILLNWAGLGYVDGTTVEIDFSFVPDTLVDIENAVGGSGDDSISGSAVANALAGGAGDDRLDGAGDDDTLSGGPGDDTLTGGAGSDSIDGDADDDVIVADPGNDTIDGGTGSDTYDASGTSAGVIVALGVSATGAEIGTDALAGIENAIGGSGWDTLTGDGLSNALAGSAGNDALSGGGGSDAIDGGAGDDSISYAYGDGSDAIAGGEGGETLGDTLTVALENGTAGGSNLTGTASGSTLTLTLDDAASPTVTDVETLVIEADVDGSSVTLSGDLTATGISSSTVVFDGSAAADDFDGSGVTSATTLELSGNGGADTLTGGAGNDLIQGGTGDDELRGNGGSDAIDGGSENAGTLGDVAVYGDTPLTAAAITYSGTWQVASASDGADLLTEIETVRDGAGNDFLLVGGDGFGSIQSAIDAASDGDTIVIAAGTWNESVTITKAVTIVGAGVGSTIVTPPGANQSGFRIDSDLGAGNGVSIRGISFVDATQSGIQFTSSGVLGTLAIEDCAFEGNYRNGVEVLNGTGLGAIAISDSTFTDNGGQDTGDLVQTSSGDGDILLFQYTGDATLSNLALSNGGQAIATAENGIQFRSDTGAMGSVSLTDITISGSYEKVPLAIYNYDDVSGLSATNVVITADSTSFQHAVNFDGVGGAIDFSALGVDVSGAPDPIALQGDATANAFTSGAENAILVGNGGSDTLDGGGGDDSFLEYVGDGSDSLTGGSGSDTLTVRLDNDFVPPIGQANGDSSDLSGTLNGSNQLELSWGDTGHVDTVSGIESIVITADADGSSVTLSGDLSLAGVSPSTVTFVGGPGNDSYDGSGVVGVDQEIFGNGGDDTLSGGAGNDTIDGGADDDTYDASGTSAGVIVTLGGSATGAEIGTDTLAGLENAIGGSGGDSLTGDANANALTGGSGNDTLSGAGGIDALSGGANDDTFVAAAGDGDDSIDGGSGSDTYDASALATGVTVTLGAPGSTSGAIGTDSLTGIENATGGSGADTLSGDAAANVLTGNGGADAISGGAGNDAIFGGGGNDTIDDGEDIDDADGGADNDTFNGALDGDDDTYRGGAGTDTIRFAAATSAVVIDLTNGMLPFGNASGAQIGFSNRLYDFENMQGGSGNDTLTGNALANVAYASAGSDSVDGMGGSDTYDSSAAVSGVSINLGSGTYSGIGSGTLASVENAIGGAGADNIIGSTAENVLTGNAGADGLSGGDGDDRLIGGANDDTLVGGGGSDTAVFTGNYLDYTVGVGTITDNIGGRDGTDSFSDIEYLEFADQTISLVAVPLANDDLDATGPSGNLAIDVLANDTESDGSTPLTAVSVTSNVVSSAPGNGLALVLDDDRILYVGDDGFAGSDGFQYTVTTSEGSDSAQVDLVVQAPGALAESSFINGSSGDEVLVGTATNNFMFGGGGNDDLYTLAGENTADAGSGNDLLVADGGGNQLTGGLGTDLFVLTHEPAGVNEFEVVTDWSQGEGDRVLVALEGLTGSDGAIEASRIDALEFAGDTFLLADLDDSAGTGIGGLEAVLARLDDVTGVTAADILANDLWV